MDSLDLVELGTGLGEEFPGWSLTDEEYDGFDGDTTIGDLYRSLQKIHPPIEHDAVWLRLRHVIARCHGVSAESIRPETRLLQN